MPEPRAQPTRGGGIRINRSDAIFSMAIVPIFLVLAILDVVTPTGQPLTPLTGALSYGFKTALGAGVFLLGSLTLFRARLPFIFRLAVLLYVAVVLFWFMSWMTGPTRGDATTFLTNPYFSVWSWLMILVVPITITFNGRGLLTEAIAKIPVPPLVGALIIAEAVETIQRWGINLASAAVGILFIVACRTRYTLRSRISAAITALILAVVMALGGYRIYSLAFSIFAISYVAIPRYNRPVFILSTLLLICTPILYVQFKDVVSETLSSEDGPIAQDTRSFLFTELFDDFSPSEVALGRGLNGTYYSPYFAYIAQHDASSVGQNNIWRTGSEVSWLNMILKLGLIGLIPFMTALLTPVFLRQRNQLSVLPIDGMQRFVPMIILIFAAELPNQISVSYFSWYICIGTLIVGSYSRVGTSSE